MAVKPPKDMEQYEKRVAANYQVTGVGLGVTQHIPCPWCAAPDFKVFTIPETNEAMAKESTCSSCGRSGKTLIENEGGTTKAEIVQTAGDDPPDWLDPAPRRI